MRILQVLPRFMGNADLIHNLERLGGAERYVVNLCRAERRLGHDSSVMVFAGRENTFEVGGVRVFAVKAVPFVRGLNQEFDPLPRELGQFVNSLSGYDIVHTHSVASDISILISLIKWISRKRYRLVVTDHGWSGLTLARIITMRKPLMRFSGFDGLLPVTRSSFSDYENSSRVFEPLYGGVDPDLFRPLGGQRRRDILFVGRVMPHKRVENLIRALSSLEYKPRLIVIGPTLDHEYKYFLANLSRELNVETCFLGPISDESLVDYYSSSTALALPSSEELFGLVLVEAMACELPVVANNARGIPDAVDDGTTGYLVRPDDIQQLSERLQLLLEDHEEARRIGAAGRQKVLEKFTWQRVAERALAAYEEVLK